MSLTLRDAADARNKITKAQEEEIRKLYEQWAKDVGRQADYYHNKTTPSSLLQEANLRQLQNQLIARSHQISNQVNSIIKNGMYQTSEATISSTIDWMKGFGFSGDGLSALFTSVPDDVVRRLVTGQVYNSGWSLSKAIWSDNEKTLKDIYTIIGAGRAQNSSVYDISKQLQRYVNPQKAKSWNPVIKMKNTKTGEYEYKRIYKSAVDYNAQRLARTLIQHTYQQTLISAAARNPFIEEFIWWATGSRACAECEERDGHKFKAAELPLDHPNGMCVMEPVVDEDKMVQDLADWVSSPDGTYPDIDKFAKIVGYTPTAAVIKANTKLSKYFEGKVEESIKTQVAESMKYISKTFDIDVSEYINLKFKIEEKRMQGERMYFSSGDKKVHIFQAELKDFLNGEYTTSDIVHEIIHGIEHKAVYKGSLSGDVQAKAMKSFIKEVSKESNIKLTQAEIKNLFGNYATKDKNSEFITMVIQSGFDTDGYINKKSELSKKRKAVYDATIKVLKNKIK